MQCCILLCQYKGSFCGHVNGMHQSQTALHGHSWNTPFYCTTYVAQGSQEQCLFPPRRALSFLTQLCTRTVCYCIGFEVGKVLAIKQCSLPGELSFLPATNGSNVRAGTSFAGMASKDVINGNGLFPDCQSGLEIRLPNVSFTSVYA